jgi:N12 class adenine-specific DNA methylase
VHSLHHKVCKVKGVHMCSSFVEKCVIDIILCSVESVPNHCLTSAERVIYVLCYPLIIIIMISFVAIVFMCLLICDTAI